MKRLAIARLLRGAKVRESSNARRHAAGECDGNGGGGGSGRGGSRQAPALRPAIIQ